MKSESIEVHKSELISNPKPLNKDELLRRLPEINNIEDNELKEQVIDIFLNNVPDYFWLEPSSSSGKYHHPACRGTFGLWIHTKIAFTLFERISRGALALDEISEEERDYGRAGILLHDILKYGEPPAGEHTVGDHDVRGYQYLKDNTDIPEEVVGCVVSHNGNWGEGRKPKNELEKLHHYADMGGSDKSIMANIDWPKELKSVIENTN